MKEEKDYAIRSHDESNCNWKHGDVGRQENKGGVVKDGEKKHRQRKGKGKGKNGKTKGVW